MSGTRLADRVKVGGCDHDNRIFGEVLTLCAPMIRASGTSGASLEATRELWASSLREVKGRMRPLFTQERVAGDPGPWRQQAVLGRGRWDADALRDVVRDYALETLADPDAVLVLDETGFLASRTDSERLKSPQII